MNPKDTRQLICLLTGHIDHGKSQIVESITGTSIIKKEAGRITQKISAISAPEARIKKICKPLLAKVSSTFEIPGLLLIDSPGHASFTNLRKRGGNIADMAVLVVDINEGIKPQTIEALEILKRYKTPFVVAANKIDLIHGWIKKSEYLTEDISTQREEVFSSFNQKLYSIVGDLFTQGFNADIFTKVQDYTKQVAIIPVSAKTGEGLPELLMVLLGIAQKFLGGELRLEREKPAKGVILEIKKGKGMGTVLSTIIYEGNIKAGDKLVIGGIDEPIETRVKCIFSCDKGAPKTKEIFYAASAVELIVTESEGIFSGMPVRVANRDAEKIKKEVQEVVDEVLLETDKEGIVVKADSLGSLEAVIQLLKENGIRIKRASIGDISKKDIAEAKSDSNELNQVIVGFNVAPVPTSEIKVITSDVIYQIVDNILEFREKKQKEMEILEMKEVTKPFKAMIMSNYVFRQSNPAVVGVEVLGGTLVTDIKIMKKDGSSLPEISSIQAEGKSVNSVEKGKQVAIAINHVIVGRQINEGDILYSDLEEKEFRKLKDMKKLLNQEEIEILKEIAEIKRKQNPMWGV
jgi:translation initiation factor 5B